MPAGHANCRFDVAIEIRDCQEHRAARAQALATLGLLDAALQDVQSALAVNQAVGPVRLPIDSSPLTFSLSLSLFHAFHHSCIIHAQRAPIPSLTPPLFHPLPLITKLQNGIYLRNRATLYMRMGKYQDALIDFRNAAPPLKEAGESTVECVFNRAYCHR